MKKWKKLKTNGYVFAQIGEKCKDAKKIKQMVLLRRSERMWTGRKDLERRSPRLKSRLSRQSLKGISEEEMFLQHCESKKMKPICKYFKDDNLKVLISTGPHAVFVLQKSQTVWMCFLSSISTSVPGICLWARGCSSRSSSGWRKPRSRYGSRTGGPSGRGNTPTISSRWLGLCLLASNKLVESMYSFSSKIYLLLKPDEDKCKVFLWQWSRLSLLS